jgi:hypothetical protein
MQLYAAGQLRQVSCFDVAAHCRRVEHLHELGCVIDDGDFGMVGGVCKFRSVENDSPGISAVLAL